MKLVQRYFLRARYLVLKWLGENIEQPATRFKTKRSLKILGFTELELSETSGESEMYTWAAVGPDLSPRFLVKASPIFRIRPLWRQRKPSQLFKRMRVSERIEYIHHQAGVFNEAGYGPRSLSESNSKIAIIDWEVGDSLAHSSAAPDYLKTVVEATLEISRKGNHHGDLHLGNVIVGRNGTVSFIDSDNQFLNHIDDDTALAVDLATLTGSFLLKYQSDEVDMYLGAIRDVFDDLLLADVIRVSTEFSSENRWLRAVSEILD